MVYSFLLMNILFLVAGQILWKVAVMNIKSWSIHAIGTLLLSPFFWGGAMLYVLATCLWLVVLSKLPLSVAYPTQSISYVFGAVLALLLFKETVTTVQWVGMIIILFGVFLVAK